MTSFKKVVVGSVVASLAAMGSMFGVAFADNPAPPGPIPNPPDLQHPPATPVPVPGGGG